MICGVFFLNYLESFDVISQILKEPLFEERLIIAREMKNNGESVEMIIKYSKLSKEDIEKL